MDDLFSPGRDPRRREAFEHQVRPTIRALLRFGYVTRINSHSKMTSLKGNSYPYHPADMEVECRSDMLLRQDEYMRNIDFQPNDLRFLWFLVDSILDFR